MHQAPAADAENRRSAAAPAELDAAAEDVGGIRPRRDVEHQTRQDKQPEFLNSEHEDLAPPKRTETAFVGSMTVAMTLNGPLPVNCITIASHLILIAHLPVASCPVSIGLCKSIRSACLEVPEFGERCKDAWPPSFVLMSSAIPA